MHVRQQSCNSMDESRMMASRHRFCKRLVASKLYCLRTWISAHWNCDFAAGSAANLSLRFLRMVFDDGALKSSSGSSLTSCFQNDSILESHMHTMREQSFDGTASNPQS